MSFQNSQVTFSNSGQGTTNVCHYDNYITLNCNGTSVSLDLHGTRPSMACCPQHTTPAMSVPLPMTPAAFSVSGEPLNNSVHSGYWSTAPETGHRSSDSVINASASPLRRHQTNFSPTESLSSLGSSPFGRPDEFPPNATAARMPDATPMSEAPADRNESRVSTHFDGIHYPSPQESMNCFAPRMAQSPQFPRPLIFEAPLHSPVRRCECFKAMRRAQDNHSTYDDQAPHTYVPSVPTHLRTHISVPGPFPTGRSATHTPVPSSPRLPPRSLPPSSRHLSPIGPASIPMPVPQVPSVTSESAHNSPFESTTSGEQSYYAAPFPYSPSPILLPQIPAGYALPFPQQPRHPRSSDILNSPTHFNNHGRLT